jgi:photosystem II CP47 chlorophyll apoprotein
MSNTESVLSTSIVSVFLASIISSSIMWYGSVSSSIELLGPSRYHWDNGYFSQDLEGRVLSVNRMLLNKSWEQVPDKLVLYDYIGCNPSKSGIFRAGSILKGDGVIQNWIGHSNFEIGTLQLSVVRCPAFFETFPVILVDSAGTIRADVGFRRASSSNSIEQRYPIIILYWSGGILDNLGYNTTSVLKNYARKAEFGEILTFDVESTQADGVFRTSARGWYSFSHLMLAFLFSFGHLWHASRTIFQYNWTGINISSIGTSEYGFFEKLADRSSSSSISV